VDSDVPSELEEHFASGEAVAVVTKAVETNEQRSTDWQLLSSSCSSVCELVGGRHSSLPAPITTSRGTRDLTALILLARYSKPPYWPSKLC
jgi:hypothetical protein